MPDNPTCEQAKAYIMAHCVRSITLLNWGELHERFGLAVREDRFEPFRDRIGVRLVCSLTRPLNVEHVVNYFEVYYGARRMQIELRSDHVHERNDRLGLDCAMQLGPTMLDIYFVYGKSLQASLSAEDWEMAPARPYSGGMPLI